MKFIEIGPCIADAKGYRYSVAQCPNVLEHVVHDWSALQGPHLHCDGVPRLQSPSREPAPDEVPCQRCGRLSGEHGGAEFLYETSCMEYVAPALAQEVLDLRGAGEALAEQLRLMALSSHFTECYDPPAFDLCLAQPCVENRVAADRWAEALAVVKEAL